MSGTEHTGYTLLTRSYSATGTTELHTGKHHVLYLTREFSSESYKRFYYDEIHAIFSVKTNEFQVANVISISVALLSLLLLLASLDNIFLVLGFSASMVTGILLLVINLIKGPTVRTVIQTEVNREEIICFRRQRALDKTLPRLISLIQDAQTSLVKQTETAPVTEPPTDEAAAPMNGDTHEQPPS